MQFCCCNLSPRGDGNRDVIYVVRANNTVAIYPREGTETRLSAIFSGLASLQFIPARGRKPVNGAQHVALLRVAIYPREGTETLVLTNDVSDYMSCNLSPRGDGNLSWGHYYTSFLVAIYPREGTET